MLICALLVRTVSAVRTASNTFVVIVECNSKVVFISFRCRVFVGYVVEKCEDGTDVWEKVPGTIPSTKNDHVVKDLEPGKKYKFRVKAQNKFGPGQPVETNTAILAKNPFGNH